MQNVYFPNLSEEVFLVYEEEINPNDEAITGTFYKKEFQKANQKEFELKTLSRKKVKNYM